MEKGMEEYKAMIEALMTTWWRTHTTYSSVTIFHRCNIKLYKCLSRVFIWSVHGTSRTATYCTWNYKQFWCMQVVCTLHPCNSPKKYIYYHKLSDLSYHVHAQYHLIGDHDHEFHMVYTLSLPSPPLPSIAIWRSGRGVDAELRTAVKAYLNNIVQCACTDVAIWYDRGPAASNYQYLLLLLIISNDVQHFIQRRIAIEQCFYPTKVLTR